MYVSVAYANDALTRLTQKPISPITDNQKPIKQNQTEHTTREVTIHFVYFCPTVIMQCTLMNSKHYGLMSDSYFIH